MRRVLFLLVAVVAALLPAAAAGAEGATVRVLARLDGPLDVVLDDLADADVEPEQLRTYGRLPWIATELPADEVGVLRASDAVASVVPDEVVDVELSESVPLINADDAVAAGFPGTGQRVAILDTGVESSHPALAGKVVAEACFSMDADCPGGVTSSTAAGSAAPCSYAPGDCFHGTHVAGIAAGVATGAQVVAVQVFSDFGGEAAAYTSDVVAGLSWLYNNRSTLNVAAANLSLGGDTLYAGTCDGAASFYKSAIDQLRGVGVATVVSAGNAGDAAGMSSPACVSTAVSVGSTTKSDAISSFSNRSAATTIMAPGSSIYAPLTGGTYGYLSGTSMAAPHVTGAIAQLKQAAPSAAVADVVTAMRATGVNVGGYPRLDVRGALGSLVPAAGQPRSLAATTGDGTLSFSWAAPLYTGGSAITGYRVGVDGVTTDVAANVTTHSLTGLTNGTPVTFTVATLNGTGAGTAASVTARPAALPGAPTITAVTGGNGRATVTWTPPASTGGSGVSLTGYRVTSTPATTAVTVDGAATSATVTGLTNGTAYTFAVEAVNSTGTGPASAASSAVTPAPVAPGAPTGVTATAGDGSATVSWTAPADDGGSAITAYVVTPSTGSAVTTTALSATVPVPNGTAVTFTVVARNAVGDSPASSASVAVTPMAPTTTTTAAPAPAPAPAPSGGGGGGGLAPIGATTTTTAPTTSTTVPRTTTTVPAPTTTTLAPPSPGVAVTGGVVAIRDGAPVLLSVPNPTGQPVLAGAVTPSGDGAWTVTADGAIHVTGDAKDLGDLEGMRLNKPLVGMAPTATGNGYWLLASDGGIFTFGDARFLGSTGAIRLNQPITTMAATPTGKGYWLLAKDGGVFTFGDARFLGSTGAMRLNQPIAAMAPTPTGKGYWLVAGDGGVFTFGDARFAGAGSNGARVTSLAPTTTGRGYWLLTSSGHSIAYGDAKR